MPPRIRQPQNARDFDITNEIRIKLFAFGRALRLVHDFDPKLAVVYRGLQGKYMAVVSYYDVYESPTSQKILKLLETQLEFLPPLNPYVIGHAPHQMSIGDSCRQPGRFESGNDIYNVFYVADFSPSGIGLPEDALQAIKQEAKLIKGIRNNLYTEWIIPCFDSLRAVGVMPENA